MHGIRRVIVFCALTTILPTMLLVIPLYLRHSFYADVAYAVTESDILEVTDGVSTVFCSEHILQMNGTFNAFQMSQRPEVTSYRQHIRLKKSMNLPDDTLEYWGFYLLKGATVALSVCSRFEGASILVVKGERNLRTCGMLEHNDRKQTNTQGIFIPGAKRQVKITFESNAQEINSQEHNPGNESEHEVHTVNPSTASGKHDADINYNSTSDTTAALARDYYTASPSDKSSNDSLEALFHTAENYIQKHIDGNRKSDNTKTRRIRHLKMKHAQIQLSRQERKSEEPGDEAESNNREYYVKKLKSELDEQTQNGEEMSAEQMDLDDYIVNDRRKRSQELLKPPSLLDRGILHGGNADRNTTSDEDASSVSSFENGLLNCYGGSILLAEEFEPSEQCINVTYLLTGKHMETRHQVVENGYYYYIFYSDNDIVSNDIHALFDIYKPTFQYENVTKSCINQTECSFSLDFLSADRVIVEVPTRNGIEHEADDTSLLVSICRPRMEIYMIFPIAVLFLIISCAFM